MSGTETLLSYVPAAIVAGTLGIWCLATFIYALPAGKRILNRPGIPVQFIPMWNFFAPNPGVYDYFLLFRDSHAGGFVAPWKETPHFASDRPWFAFLWNPQKIEKKVLFDLVTELLREAEQIDSSQSEIQRLKLSIPYLFLLQYISNLPRGSFSTATQFTVMRRSRDSDLIEPVFVSGFHYL